MKLAEILLAAALITSVAFADGPPKFVSLEEQVTEHADRILIPRVKLTDVPLADALEFLRGEARARDPKHQGIAIQANLRPAPMIVHIPGTKTEMPPPPGGWPLDDLLKTPITISLSDISLLEALREVVALANCNAVPTRTGFTIFRFAESAEPMYTHTIPLGRARMADLKRMRADPRQYFIDQGVAFVGTATCSFEDGGETLVISNTRDQLDLVHTVLENSVREEPAKKSK